MKLSYQDRTVTVTILVFYWIFMTDKLICKHNLNVVAEELSLALLFTGG